LSVVQPKGAWRIDFSFVGRCNDEEFWIRLDRQPRNRTILVLSSREGYDEIWRFIQNGTQHCIRVWNLSLRELINIPTEDISQVGAWASLLDGHIIVSGSSEGTYDFWDATDGMPIRFCTAHRGSKGLHFIHLASAPSDLTAQRWERVIRDADRWQAQWEVKRGKSPDFCR